MTDNLIHHENLRVFSQQVIMKLGAFEEDAYCVADNLVKSNLRGIDSHGVGRLKRYVEGIRTGYILPKASPIIERDSPVMANINAMNGLGQPAGVFGMNVAIEKAQHSGVGMVTVFDSNHYGFAGYYAMMALERDLIGISMTNSEPLVVPTFSKNAMIGTNPIAFAAPTKNERPWVMDLATSVVPSGKLEVYDRLGKEIPEGWATNESGRSTNSPAEVLVNLYKGLGKGGICPLGGEGELHGGHKGYGLGTMVEILCGVMSGANILRDVTFVKDGKPNHPKVGHFFMAFDPSFFTDIDSFKNRMDEMISRLKNAEKAEGQSRIFIHGEKEFEEHERREQNGIPIDEKTVESLIGFSKEFSIDLEFIE
ncbi:Ldh family oxidoreductase [Candidatus Thorarchaeota archaeon]|nr:MAG: Ldh family oxidoreductase [Candidatus Thorarchaeota archaeon]